MKKIFFILSLALISSIFVPHVLAQSQAKPIEIYFFRGEGCPHCAQEEIGLGELSSQYQNLKIKQFEVYYNNDNRQLYFAFSRAYNLNLSELVVPVTFIGEKSFLGYTDDIKNQMKNEIIRCSNQICPSPQDKVLANQNNPVQGTTKQLIIGWAIILAVLFIIVFVLVKLFKRKK